MKCCFRLNYFFFLKYKPNFFLKKSFSNHSIFSKNFFYFIFFVLFLKKNLFLPSSYIKFTLKKKKLAINSFLTAPNRHKTAQIKLKSKYYIFDLVFFFLLELKKTSFSFLFLLFNFFFFNFCKLDLNLLSCILYKKNYKLFLNAMI